MVFSYAVKLNGVKYLPGTEVPVDKDGNEINEPIPAKLEPEKSPLEETKEVFKQKADETIKKSKGGRKPKQ